MSEAKRPGLVTFIGILMFILGGFHIVAAIPELLNSIWVKDATWGYLGGAYFFWGILDIVVGLIAFVTGYDVLRGGAVGRAVGMLWAGLSAIRWFFFVPGAPTAALIVIALDVIVIYGLATSTEYFGS